MAGWMIEVERVEKRFGAVQALAGVDLAAERGTVLGLLGPNGAGKTTLVRILATLLRPDAGRAAVVGYDVVADAADVASKATPTGSKTETSAASPQPRPTNHEHGRWSVFAFRQLIRFRLKVCRQLMNSRGPVGVEASADCGVSFRTGIRSRARLARA